MVERALFGMEFSAWLASWEAARQRIVTAVGQTGGVLMLGYGLRYMLLAFDDKQTARMLQVPLLLWALATLLRGCAK